MDTGGIRSNNEVIELGAMPPLQQVAIGYRRYPLQQAAIALVPPRGVKFKRYALKILDNLRQVPSRGFRDQNSFVV